VSINVNELCFSYSGHEVLKGVSFEAEAGQLMSVLGPNGVGKSTLFKCILGILRGYTGEIHIDGENAANMRARALADKIAYIPQSHGNSFGYTVEDMVLMGTAHSVGTLSVPRRAQKEAAWAAMERTGITGIAGKNYLKLSGGEQQLAMIARALAQKSRILLMDEPTSNLDYGNQERILKLVRSLADDGYTVLLSTHNPQHALWYADSVLALLGGKVEAFGGTEVITPELIKRLYNIEITFAEENGTKVIIPSKSAHK